MIAIVRASAKQSEAHKFFLLDFSVFGCTGSGGPLELQFDQPTTVAVCYDFEELIGCACDIPKNCGCA